MLLFAHGGGGGPVLITLPNFAGVSLAAAQQVILDLGLSFAGYISQYDETIAVGSVVSQDPAAGSMVSAGSTVRFVISLGPDPRNLGEVSRMRFTSYHSHMRFKVQ